MSQKLRTYSFPSAVKAAAFGISFLQIWQDIFSCSLIICCGYWLLQKRMWGEAELAYQFGDDSVVLQNSYFWASFLHLFEIKF